MEEDYPRSPKQKMMSRLRVWASERDITLYGKVKEAPNSGYMQWGRNRRGSRLYLVDDENIYRWGGLVNGWKPMVCEEALNVES